MYVRRHGRKYPIYNNYSNCCRYFIRFTRSSKIKLYYKSVLEESVLNPFILQIEFGATVCRDNFRDFQTKTFRCTIRTKRVSATEHFGRLSDDNNDSKRCSSEFVIETCRLPSIVWNRIEIRGSDARTVSGGEPQGSCPQPVFLKNCKSSKT